MKTNSTDLINQNKVFALVALVTGLLLSVPAIAMQFTSEVGWDVTDFTIMGILLFGVGSFFVLIVRVTPRKYRAILGIAVLAAFLLTWAHLAVGIVDSWPSAGS